MENKAANKRSRIAVIERGEVVLGDGFDKIISFLRDGNAHISEYLDVDKLPGIYDDMFFSLYDWIGACKKAGGFLYEGVDILDAYGKKIFDFAFNLYQKMHAVESLIERERPDELWVEESDNCASLKYPQLCFFLKHRLLGRQELRYFRVTRPKNPLAGRGAGVSTAVLGFALNILRNFARITLLNDKDGILIYSDLKKIPELLEYLKGERIIFLREKLPLRHVPYLSRKGVDIRLFSDVRISEADEDALEDAKDEFIRRLRSIESPLYVCGIDFSVYIKRWLAGIWDAELKGMLRQVKQAHMIFRKLSIKSLLVDEDRTEKKNMLIQVSKQYGCSSYVNCHGDPFHRIAYTPLTADHIMVWGDSHKELLIKWGAAGDRVIVTGCSKYKAYADTDASGAKEKICRDLGLSASKQVVLFAACPFSMGRELWRADATWQRLEMVLKVLKGFDDMQLIIKLHPMDESEAHIREYVAKMKLCDVRVIKNYDSLLLASGADILVTYLSTFSLDGIAYRKAVILTDSWSLDRYGRLNVFYNGSDEDKLRDALSGVSEGRYKDHIINWQSGADHCLNGMHGTALSSIAVRLKA